MSAAKVANTNNFEKGLLGRAKAAESRAKELEAALSEARNKLFRDREAHQDINEAIDVLTHCLDGAQGMDRDELRRLCARLQRNKWVRESVS